MSFYRVLCLLYEFNFSRNLAVILEQGYPWYQNLIFRASAPVSLFGFRLKSSEIKTTQIRHNFKSPRSFLVQDKLGCYNKHCMISVMTLSCSFPARVYLLKVNSRNKIINEICKKLTIKKPELRHVIDVVLMSLLLTLNRFHTLFWSSHCQLL